MILTLVAVVGATVVWAGEVRSKHLKTHRQEWMALVIGAMTIGAIGGVLWAL